MCDGLRWKKKAPVLHEAGCRAVVDSTALHWVIKSEGITGQLLAILVIDERGFIC